MCPSCGNAQRRHPWLVDTIQSVGTRKRLSCWCGKHRVCFSERRALASAGVERDAVNYVNAHATSTQVRHSTPDPDILIGDDTMS